MMMMMMNECLDCITHTYYVRIYTCKRQMLQSDFKHTMGCILCYSEELMTGPGIQTKVEIEVDLKLRGPRLLRLLRLLSLQYSKTLIKTLTL